MNQPSIEKDKSPDTGLTISLCTLIFAATFYFSSALRNTVSPEDNYTIISIVWAIATGFFSVLSMACTFALICKIVSVLTPDENSYWTKLSSLMLRFCLYILIRWIGLWGVPFVIAIGIFLKTKNIIGDIPAYIITGVIIITLIYIIRRLISKETLSLGFSMNLFHEMKKSRAVLFIISCFIVYYFSISSQYDFDSHVSKNFYEQSDMLELIVTLKGRIRNHDKLTADIYTNKNNKIAKNLKFKEFSEGKYIAWLELSTYEPGLYRGEIYFSNFKDSAYFKKWNLFLGNNHLRKNVTFYIMSERGHR